MLYSLPHISFQVSSYSWRCHRAKNILKAQKKHSISAYCYSILLDHLSLIITKKYYVLVFKNMLFYKKSKYTTILNDFPFVLLFAAQTTLQILWLKARRLFYYISWFCGSQIGQGLVGSFFCSTWCHKGLSVAWKAQDSSSSMIRALVGTAGGLGPSRTVFGVPTSGLANKVGSA